MKDELVKLYTNNSTLINIILIVGLLLVTAIYIIYRKKINEIYKKHKEIINYVIVGGLTTLISIVSYWLFRFFISNYIVLSVISWVLAVAFAYVTNRIFVFESKSKDVIKETTKFIGSRLVTLGLEVVLMILFVSVFKMNDMLAKVILQVVVLIVNYIFSKLFVFKKDKETTQ